MDPNRNVLHKIRSLLRRAEANSGASLNEQLTCAEIAQRLMDQYRITYEVVMSESDIPKSAQEPVIDYIKEKHDHFTSITNPSDWIKGLYHVVALANNCEVYLTTCLRDDDDGKPEKFIAFSIVGRMTDILVVGDICWWLITEVLRIGRREGSGKDISWHNDFRMGAVRKLKEKFDALKGEKREIPGISEEQIKNALVRLDEKRKEVADFFDKNGGGERWKDSEKKKAQDNVAFARGYNAAEEIAVSQSAMLPGEKKMLSEGNEPKLLKA